MSQEPAKQVVAVRLAGYGKYVLDQWAEITGLSRTNAVRKAIVDQLRHTMLNHDEWPMGHHVVPALGLGSDRHRSQQALRAGHARWHQGLPYEARARCTEARGVAEAHGEVSCPAGKAGRVSREHGHGRLPALDRRRGADRGLGSSDHPNVADAKQMARDNGIELAISKPLHRASVMTSFRRSAGDAASPRSTVDVEAAHRRL
jgi:hypothetical protein